MVKKKEKQTTMVDKTTDKAIHTLLNLGVELRYCGRYAIPAPLVALLCRKFSHKS